MPTSQKASSVTLQVAGPVHANAARRCRPFVATAVPRPVRKLPLPCCYLVVCHLYHQFITMLLLLLLQALAAKFPPESILANAPKVGRRRDGKPSQAVPGPVAMCLSSVGLVMHRSDACADVPHRADSLTLDTALIGTLTTTGGTSSGDLVPLPFYTALTHTSFAPWPAPMGPWMFAPPLQLLLQVEVKGWAYRLPGTSMWAVSQLRPLALITQSNNSAAPPLDVHYSINPQPAAAGSTAASGQPGAAARERPPFVVPARDSSHSPERRPAAQQAGAPSAATAPLGASRLVTSEPQPAGRVGGSGAGAAAGQQSSGPAAGMAATHGLSVIKGPAWQDAAGFPMSPSSSVHHYGMAWSPGAAAGLAAEDVDVHATQRGTSVRVRAVAIATTPTPKSTPVR